MYDLENKSIIITRRALDHKSFSRKPYAPYNYRICMIRKGGGVWQIGKTLYSVSKDDIILLNNRQERVFREVSPTDGIELLIIEFDPQFIFNTRFQQLFINIDAEFSCKISGNKEIRRLINDMEQEARNKLANHRIIIGAKLFEVLSLISRYYNISDTGNHKISADLYKVLEYINENYSSGISLDKAARFMHMSASGFSKYFTKCMGIGFSQYVMQKRIHYAVHLLERSEKTVLDISMDCGFNNPASFYKAFRKVTNRTPHYFRNLREDHCV